MFVAHPKIDADSGRRITVARAPASVSRVEKASSESVRTLPALRVSKELMLEDILIDR